MALAFKIKKAAYDALTPEMQAEYVAGETAGEFLLDVSGLPEAPDTGPLERALKSERDKVKELTGERNQLKADIAAMPDVEALKATHEAEKGKLTKFADKTLKDSVAIAIATKISTAPSLLADKIAARISVDLTGDEPKTVFLGADGKPDPELTAEKISQEFVANKEYAAIIIGSKASGSGTQPRQPNSQPVGGVTPPNGEQQPKLISAMSPAERVEHIKARKIAEAAAAQQ